MELWIRSQDRMKLVNNCNLYISNEIRNEYVIEDLSNKYLKLGTYRTLERALEVFDEIQKIINGEIAMQKEVESQIVGCKKIIVLNVYEMPKE